MDIRILATLVCLSAYEGAILVGPLKNPDDYGASVQFKNQDPVGNYNFGYNEGHLSGGSFRRETGDAYGNKVGSYGLRDADGRLRIVNYIADSNGFRVKVDTNEPGVEPQDPASASINKPALVPPPAQPVIAPFVKGPVIPSAPIFTSPVVQAPLYPPPVPIVTAPIVAPPPVLSAPIIPSAPLLPTPVLSSYNIFPPSPLVLPPKYLNVPSYVNSVYPLAPYNAPYKGYNAQMVGNYYKPSPIYSKNQQSVYGGIAVDPPRYLTQPYSLYGGKSLPTYQPLGYS